ncbi:MBL fold metallo-hydrolase [Georgenia sp. Z1491]|uniref:MBL fold metallo-hydrolase n=1 Tax=Georgenia sp. Z1491 TaxID=3416707 RepID=UPI003CF555B6
MGRAVTGRSSGPVIEVGDLRVLTLEDGHGREVARDVLTREGHADGWSCHGDLLDEQGDLHLAVGGYLLQSGDRTIVVDTGAGTIDNGRYKGGLLLESLRVHGVEVEDVTDVLLTHLHFDHVGWVSKKGSPVFPRATYRVHEADWNHFVDAPDAQPGALRKLEPIREQLETFDASRTIAPGLDARPMPGHTPGSTSFVVSDGKDRLVLVGDLAHSPVELVETGWRFRHDHDQELAARSRTELVEEFTDTGAVIAAAHFPDFRPGRLVAGPTGPRWSSI